MDIKNIIKDKQILIVDDEPDVLESLIELLDICKIDTASSFEEGRRLLEDRDYDIAILDILGVKGFELLKIACDQKIPALMLTANKISEESLRKSAEDGAVYFVPKDRMIDINIFLADIFIALQTKQSTWEKWFNRLGGFFDSHFHGTDWREKEKKFWENKMKNRF